MASDGSDSSAGTSEDAARADHRHDIIDTSLSSEAHTHDTDVSINVSTDVLTVSAGGTSDTVDLTSWQDTFVSSAPASSIGNNASSGGSNLASRRDHVHDTSVSLSLNTANTLVMNVGGNSNSQSLSSIIVDLNDTNSTIVDVDGSSGSSGSSDEGARADHRHDITGYSSTLHAHSFGTPVNVGTSNSSGSGSLVARSNHVHNISNSISLSGTTLTSNVGGNTDTVDLSGLGGGTTTLSYGDDSDVLNINGNANDAGSSDDVARIDHRHDISGFSTTSHSHTLDFGENNDIRSIGSSNAAGSGNEIARATHIHTTSITASLNSSDILSLNIGGNTDTVDLSSLGGTPSTLSYGDDSDIVASNGSSNDAGTLDNVARADHRHDVTGFSTTSHDHDTTVTINNTTDVLSVTAGGNEDTIDLTTWKRTILSNSNPSNIGDSLSAGTSNLASRRDHVHDTSVGLSLSNTTLTVDIGGNSDTINLSGLGGGTLDYGVTADIVSVGQASPASGTDDDVARIDHRHGVNFGTAVDIGTSNTAGSGSLIARSNHIHAGSSGGSTEYGLSLTLSTGVLNLVEDGNDLDIDLLGSDNSQIKTINQNPNDAGVSRN